MDQIVECRSDWVYAQRPLAFHWQGQRRVVQKIIADWRTPQGIQFLVCMEDNEFFELSYTESLDQWNIQPHAAKERA